MTNIGMYLSPPLMSPRETMETIIDEHAEMVKRAARANAAKSPGVMETEPKFRGMSVWMPRAVLPSWEENELKMVRSWFEMAKSSGATKSTMMLTKMM